MYFGGIVQQNILHYSTVNRCKNNQTHQQTLKILLEIVNNAIGVNHPNQFEEKPNRFYLSFCIFFSTIDNNKLSLFSSNICDFEMIQILFIKVIYLKKNDKKMTK